MDRDEVIKWARQAHLARSDCQSEHRIRFILPAREASLVIKCVIQCHIQGKFRNLEEFRDTGFDEIGKKTTKNYISSRLFIPEYYCYLPRLGSVRIAWNGNEGNETFL